MRSTYHSGKTSRTKSGISSFGSLPSSTCLDRRDKIYALQSLFLDASKAVSVDYSIGMVELFLRALRISAWASYSGMGMLISKLNLKATELKESADKILNVAEKLDAWSLRIVNWILFHHLETSYRAFEILPTWPTLDQMHSHLRQWRLNVDTETWQSTQLKEPERDPRSVSRPYAWNGEKSTSGSELFLFMHPGWIEEPLKSQQIGLE